MKFMPPKNGMVIGLTRIGADNVQRLSFSQTVYDEKTGIEKSRKIGFLQINPDFDASKALEGAKASEWHFGSFNRTSQTYEVLAGPAPAAQVGEGELVTGKEEEA